MFRLGLCGWGAVLLRVFILVVVVAVVGCSDASNDEFTGTTLDYELAATCPRASGLHMRPARMVWRIRSLASAGNTR